MRIKINDKIYRLKEIESGVDSLMELVEEPKYKKGDKVQIKEGISSKTHCDISPSFVGKMDDFIGKTMTVDRYTDLNNYVKCEEICWSFLEDWLEPYEELKKGDLAIFWDGDKRDAAIRIYERFNGGEYFTHRDHQGLNWKNAIRYKSKEQYEKLIKREL